MGIDGARSHQGLHLGRAIGVGETLEAGLGLLRVCVVDLGLDLGPDRDPDLGLTLVHTLGHLTSTGKVGGKGGTVAGDCSTVLNLELGSLQELSVSLCKCLKT